MADIPANTLRGEADAKIGAISFRIAITFDGLARLSTALKAQTMDEIYVRLLGFEPKAVACAIPCFIVEDDQDRISEISAKILSPDNISAADQAAWRKSIEQALSAHIEAGNLRRDERSAMDIANEALLGNRASPS
ncbi:hypothetical protein SAMN05892877_105360 [Rhizobium subbaraonis]|uniref:Uncharacterized protein n=1 Tax=Rhizobium subbaraonis TaxID=908946 RepID=A0A285UFC0_9HYPH|nr:hypothetical protein [Rhizobium subbaraonis]SOC38981.1 hypothetical protein SAMN05892877_105360 [Rhizobium subbaraonis]